MMVFGNGQHELDVVVIAPMARGLPALAFGNELGELNAIEGVHIETVSGEQATVDHVARMLRQRADVMIWSGHGRPGCLAVVDGEVDGEWLATQARAGAPRVLVLAACGSGVTLELDNLLTEISRVGINAVGMPLAVGDRVAILFSKEFLRALVAGADVGTAHRVAVKRVASVDAAAADGIVLVPGLTNGYRAIVDRIDAQEVRFDRLETELVVIRKLLENWRKRV